MPFTREQAVKELGELIATPPWGGGGAYPEGAKLLQNISPMSKLWSEKGRKPKQRLTDWKRSHAADPYVVADILLGIKLKGKTGTVAAFELAEAIPTAYSFNFTFKQDFKLGVFLLSALLKIGYYGIRWDYNRKSLVVFLHKKAIEQFVEYDPNTRHKPFPPWTAPRDVLGKWLVKPSKPQLKKTVWHPPKEHFKGSGYTLWEDAARANINVMENAPNVWVHAVNHLESTSYSINQDVLSIVDALPTPPKRDPSLEWELKKLKDERVKSNIDDLDKKANANKKLDKKRKDENKRKLHDGDPKRPITPAETQKRKEYYVRWYRFTRMREELESAHSLHVRVTKRARELGTEPFWNRVFVDYRGRMNLSRAVVNYQTGDLSRGLIQFAEGRRVRKKDMSYLWIHIATAWGEKGDVDARETWAKKNQKKLLRYARRPVETHGEWKDAGDKWVFIRACLELRTLLKDPKHKSQLIVEIDQSMSALQHIAMMFGDEKMMEQVNLTATYRDLYMEVGNATGELNGLDEGLKRKIVKWALMPWVYGGNEWSAYKRYATRREDVELFKKKSHPQLYAVAADVVSNLERTLDKFEVYKGMLRDYGEAQLRRSRGTKPRHIAWETPSQFEIHHYEQKTDEDQESLHSYTPVSGGYPRPIIKKGKRKGQSRSPRLTAREPNENTDDDEMLKAMAPNFLHSLDAALAQYVLIQAFERDIPCVTVHDAFGIHIRNVGEVKPLFISAFEFMYGGWRDSPLGALEPHKNRGQIEKALKKKNIKPFKADYEKNELWGSSEYVARNRPHAVT